MVVEMLHAGFPRSDHSWNVSTQNSGVGIVQTAVFDDVRLCGKMHIHRLQQFLIPEIIAVHEQNILSLRCRDACISGCADALIGLMDHMEAFVRGCITVANSSRTVTGTVVDQNDLKI